MSRRPRSFEPWLARWGAVAWCAAALLTPARAGAELRRGVVDFNGYYDTRRSSVFTVNTWAQLPQRFEYFSLLNYYNAPSAPRLGDLDRYLTEQNVRWNPIASVPLDLAVQSLHQSGPRNDALRAGLRFRLMHAGSVGEWLREQGLVYFVTLFPAQVDFLAAGYRAQLEHVYHWRVFGQALDNRLYLSGFLDHNMLLSGASSPAHTLVTEHQLGVRLGGQLHAVAEWRRNEFWPSRKNGVGLGLQYLVPFTTGNDE